MTTAERAQNVQFSSVAPKAMKKIVISSVIGTAVEWYDFLIYGTANALVFPKLFFPSADPGLSAIASFGMLGVGYFARPLGAAIFGHFGDRFGRKAMLANCHHGSRHFPHRAPPHLRPGRRRCACPARLPAPVSGSGARRRMGRRGAHGGRERASRQSRASRLDGPTRVPVGTLSATGMFALLSRAPEADFLAWTWRVPFLISILLAGIGSVYSFATGGDAGVSPGASRQ